MKMGVKLTKNSISSSILNIKPETGPNEEGTQAKETKGRDLVRNQEFIPINPEVKDTRT